MSAKGKNSVEQAPMWATVFDILQTDFWAPLKYYTTYSPEQQNPIQLLDCKGTYWRNNAERAFGPIPNLMQSPTKLPSGI